MEKEFLEKSLAQLSLYEDGLKGKENIDYDNLEAIFREDYESAKVLFSYINV